MGRQSDKALAALDYIANAYPDEKNLVHIIRSALLKLARLEDIRGAFPCQMAFARSLEKCEKESGECYEARCEIAGISFVCDAIFAGEARVNLVKLACREHCKYLRETDADMAGLVVAEDG